MTRILAVQVLLSVGATSFNFNNESNLAKAKKITGIAAYHQNDMQYTPFQSTTVNAAAFRSASLTLNARNGNDEVVSGMPLILLNPASNGGTVRKFDIGQIDPTKCKIVFGNGSAIVNNEAVFLVFWYEE